MVHSSKMTALLLAVLGDLLFQAVSSQNPIQNSTKWTWECNTENGSCVKTLLPPGSRGLGVEACRITCGPGGSLWPIPTGTISLGSRLTSVDFNDIGFTYPGQVEELARLIREAVTVLQTNLENLIPLNSRKTRWRPNRWGTGRESRISITISISGSQDDTDLTWDTDESYSLVTVESEGYIDAFINATSYYGVRHGLETLSQLAAWDTYSNSILMASNVQILDDRPAYPHRGLLVDPARNFIPMEGLYRTVNAMASCKMNVLHLHLTDSQSFPYTSKRVPVLTSYGAYPGMVYSADDMASLVHYSKVRGIRVLPEFDAPAHAGAGWDGASDTLGLGKLAVCVAAQPWRKLCIEPPCGQLNPVNPNLYPLLGKIYADMTEDFGTREKPPGGLRKGPLLHMGGDEVHIGCWNSSNEIVDWMGMNGYGRTKADFLALWADFQEKALKELDRLESNSPYEEDPEPLATAILWTSDLTNLDMVETYLNKSRYVIQAWMPASETLPVELLDRGYRLIFSTKDAWYLDHGYGNWKGSSLSGYPFHPWQVAYDNRLPGDGRSGGRVLGGEAAIWGEMVDGVSLDSKAWPRAAATAERLWSDPLWGWQKARLRMMAHRERMVFRGVMADALQPRWCFLNEQECS